MTKKKKILIWTGSLLTGLLAFLVIAFFVVTSSAFLTGVVLPRVGDSIGWKLQAEKINLSIVNGTVAITNFSAADAKEQFLQTTQLDAQISIRSLLGGKIQLNQFSLDGGKIFLARNIDGDWNCIPKKIVEEIKKRPAKPKTVSPDKILQLDLNNIKLTGIDFSLQIEHPQKITSLGFDDLTIELPRLANGQHAKLTLAASMIRIDSGEDIHLAQGNIACEAELMLDEVLFPTQITFQSTLSQLDGVVSGLALKENILRLDLEAKGDKQNYTIDKLTFQQLQNNQLRTSFELTGKTSFQPFAAQLQLKLDPLSEEIAAVGAAFALPFDPGKIALTCNGEWQISDKAISGIGEIDLARTGMVFFTPREGTPLPDFALRLKHDFTLNFADKNAEIRVLQLTVDETKQQVAAIHLTSPFHCAWPDGKLAFLGESPSLAIETNNFDLTALHLFYPELPNFKINKGVLDSNITVAIQPTRELLLNGSCGIHNLEVETLDFLYGKLNFDTQFSATGTPEGAIALKNFTLTAREANKILLESTLNGSFNTKDKKGDYAFTLTKVTTDLLALLPLQQNELTKLQTYAAPLAGYEMRLASSGAINLADSTLELKRLALYAHQNAKLPLNILCYPIKFCYAPFSLEEELTCQIQMRDFELDNFASLLPETARFRSGKLNLETVVTFKNNFKTILVQGNDTLQLQSFRLAEQTLEALELQQKFDLTIDDANLITVNNNTNHLTLSGKDAVQAELSGAVNLSQGAANVQINLSSLTGEIPAFLMRQKLPDAWLIQGLIQAKAEHFQKWTVAAQLKGSVNQQPALELKLDAAAVPADGALSGKVQIVQLNEKLIEPFFPNKIKQLELSAELNGTGNIKNKEYALDGTIKLPKFQAAQQQQQINGELVLGIEMNQDAVRCRQLSGFLKQDQTLLAHWTAGAFWPLTENVSQDGVVNIQSKALNLKTLLALFSEPETKQAATEPAKTMDPFPESGSPEPIRFHFGPRPVHLTIECDAISWGDNVNANFTGNADFRGRELLLNELLLQFNGAKFLSSGRLCSGDVDVEYTLQSQADAIELKDLLTPFLPTEYQEFSGKLTSMKLNCKGTGLKPPRLWDQLDGNVELTFGEMTIPNSLQKTTLGKLFLLPIEVMHTIKKFMPTNESIKNLDSALGVISDFYSSTENIKFSDGVIQVTSGNGKIHIKKVQFQGPVVKELTFSGTLGLGSNQKLDLSSKLNVVNVILPVKIGGTLHKTEVNITETVASFLTGNASNIIAILDVVGVTKDKNGETKEWGKALENLGALLGDDAAKEKAPKEKPTPGSILKQILE